VTTQMSVIEVAQWRDKKRYLWLMGLIAPTALFVMLPLVWAFNQWGWHAAAQAPFWIGPILLYVLLPALDLRFGPDGQNPPDEVMERLENDKYYRYCTYIYIPFQYASVILGAYLFTASNLSWLGFDGGLGWPAKIGLALSVGVLGGVGINTAHEMGHKKDELERWLSKITLAQTCYGHFYIEHPRIPRRPASARRSGSSCRAACLAACARRGSWKRSGCGGAGGAPGIQERTGPMTCSTRGRCRWCSMAY
jgi:alkane 1-monooxygenase